jgi:hypothetical protein
LICEHVDASVRERAFDQLQGRAPEADDLLPGPGIFEPKHPHGAVNLRPLEFSIPVVVHNAPVFRRLVEESAVKDEPSPCPPKDVF